MAAPRQSSFYKKHIVCPICMDMFADPRALPCLHTFCLQCLHSYVMSVTAEGKSSSKEGFECPVCRTFNTAPLHGLCPYSWAENYPPNYTVRDLVENATKQGITSNEEIGGKSKLLQETDAKRRAVGKDQNILYQEDLNRKKGFYCDFHNQPFCSSCESLGVLNGRQKTVEDREMQDSCKKTRAHRSLSRLGRSVSGDHDLPETTPVHSGVLAEEFATARAIDSPPLKPEEPRQPEPVSHMTLKRLYGEENEKRQPHETTIPVFRDFDEAMPVPIYKGIERRLVTNRSTKDEEQMLSDDLREFLSIHLPNPVVGNPVGHLNDIKEEDEDTRQADGLQSVTKSKDKIYVRIRSDDRCCSVTGLTMLPDGRVLIADEHNKNVKMFDSAGEYFNHISFTSAPFDIDSIGQCEAVVTFPGEKCVRILFITNALTVVRAIEFEKKCMGVAYHDSKFFVALETEIRVLSYNGELIHRFHRDPSKRKIFSSGKSQFLEACYVAVDDQHIYVSDTRKRCLLTLNYRGEVVASFREGEYVKMLGLCRGPERKLFVCQWPNTLFLLTVSEHGSHIRNVLVSDNIQAVHYDLKSQKLWVTQATDNFVNQYSFK